MTKSPAHVLPTSLLLLFSLVAGCGGNMMMNSSRQMQSLTVTPASADAQSFAGGIVQFTATGTFNMAPMTVTSPPVVWSIGSPMATPMPMPMSSGPKPSDSGAPATPSVNASGLAQCNGFVGKVTIQATAPVDPNMPTSQMSSMSMLVTGAAQMMCP